jgi:hypothetical protein
MDRAPQRGTQRLPALRGRHILELLRLRPGNMTSLRVDRDFPANRFLGMEPDERIVLNPYIAGEFIEVGVVQ